MTFAERIQSWLATLLASGAVLVVILVVQSGMLRSCFALDEVVNNNDAPTVENNAPTGDPVEVVKDDDRTPREFGSAGFSREFTDRLGGRMILIPEGEFWMGDNGGGRTDPRFMATMDAYYIDEREVSIRDYMEFIRDLGYFKKEYWSREGWEYIKQAVVPVDTARGLITVTYHKGFEPVYGRGLDSVPSGMPASGQIRLKTVEINPDLKYYSLDHPVTNVSYWEAEAYARWIGKQIPTEAQWEKAARGCLDARMYPWGDAYEDGPQNYIEGLKFHSPSGILEQDVSPYGVREMAGNVSEWCRDAFDLYAEPYIAQDTYEKVYSISPVNPAMPEPGDTSASMQRVVRGGDFASSGSSDVTVVARNFANPYEFTGQRGFRCVKAADR